MLKSCSFNALYTVVADDLSAVTLYDSSNGFLYSICLHTLFAFCMYIAVYYLI